MLKSCWGKMKVLHNCWDEVKQQKTRKLDRLKQRIKERQQEQAKKSEKDAATNREQTEKLPIATARLAAYENLGLEPEEIAALIMPTNQPLTMEELQEMDGESVWVDSFVKGLPSFYAVVHGKMLTGFAAGSDRIINMSPDRKGAYGLAWLAYRRKPEEGGHD